MTNGWRPRAVAIAALAAAVSASTPASADADAAASQTMQAEMERYFRAERRGGAVFVSVGTASVVAGGLLLRDSSEFAQGMSYPLLALGGAQLIAGGIVLFTPGPRIRKFTQKIADDPAGYAAEELPRIRGVTSTMRALLVTEVLLLAGGVTTAILAGQSDRDTLSGVGTGVATEAVLLLAQDYMVSRRAHRYADALAGFKAAIDVPRGSYALSWAAAF